LWESLCAVADGVHARACEPVPRLLRDSHQATARHLRRRVDAVTRAEDQELGGKSLRLLGDPYALRGLPMVGHGCVGGALLDSRPGSDEHVVRL
jgi:hypothetical protein